MKAVLKSVVTNRNFAMLWCAYGISALGDHLSEMAILASQNALDPNVDITPLQARMTFLFMLPFLVFGPIAGAVADRVPRRWIMIFADLARVGVMLVFLLLIRRCTDFFGPEWGPFLPLGMLGVFAAMFSPSRQAMVPTLVRTEELVCANAMISGLGMTATMIGALASGELAARGLIREAFFADACTYALSAVCVVLISPRRGPITPPPERTAEPLLADLAAGFRYVAGHRRVAELLLIAVTFWFSGASVRSVLPAIVKEVYHRGFVDMARFTAWIGVGLILGAVVITILGNALRSEMAITWSLFGIAASITGLALTTMIGFEPATAHNLGVLCVIASGMFGSGVVVSYNALLQRIVPDRYRGRVFGILNLVTISGLLVATGTLAIPQWSHLDRWCGFVLIAVATLLAAVGAATLAVRLRRSPLPRMYAFYFNVTEFYAKFWWRMKRYGPCTVPRHGPVIVTANHDCITDPLVLITCCPHRCLAFMIAAEYYNMPIGGHVIRTDRAIPVRRGDHDIGATKEAIKRLRRGEALGIFIQGGIRKPGEKKNLKNGVAMLALRTGATVIPAHVSGTRYHPNVVMSLLRHHDIRVRFGPPVDLSAFAGRKGRGVLDEVSQRIFDAIMALAPGDEVGTRG